MSAKMNRTDRSVRKKSQKATRPVGLGPSGSNKEVLRSSGPRKGPLRETRRGPLDEDCSAEVVEESAVEPGAANRLLLTVQKGHKPPRADGGATRGDPTLATLPEAHLGDSSSSTGASGSSSLTESSNEEDSDQSEEDSEGALNSSASDSGAEEDSASPPPDTAGPDGGIQKDLAGMSFEELLQLQNKVGTKLYNQMAYGTKKSPAMAEGGKKKPRPNKNRPMEISAKKPVPFLRQVIPVKKKVLRDPRFDDLSGEYKPEIFEKTYSFINDIKKKEKQIIEKKLKKLKDPERKEKLQQLLLRLNHQEKAEQARQKQREREQAFKKEQREQAKQGVKPYFLKKSEQRTLELADKYTDLKKSGKLESFLSKKRKRNAGKDKRRLPFQKTW